MDDLFPSAFLGFVGALLMAVGVALFSLALGLIVGGAELIIAAYVVAYLAARRR